MASKGKPKRASPKVKKTAELYKSSHNIGNRTARMRVGCYKDNEFAVEYPEGFWDPVKPPGDQSPDRGGGGVADNRSPTRGVSSAVPSSGGAKPNQPKTSKSPSGATKRKLDEKPPEMNGSVSPAKKAAVTAVKKEKITPKTTLKSGKTPTPKIEKATAKKEKGSPKKEVTNTPTKEVKIIIEKHPDLSMNGQTVHVKGKAEKDIIGSKNKKDKKSKDKKPSKELNGIKQKKFSISKSSKSEKDKSKNDTKKKKETKEKKSSTQKEEKGEESERSSDYTYDSDDSEMEISFKKRKTETPPKAAKDSPKAKVGKKATPKGKDKTNDSGKGKKLANKPTIEERAPRIKRTACLNANAIVSALYQVEDTSSHTKSSTTTGSHSKSSSTTTTTQRSTSPVASKHHSQTKRRKVSIEADLDEGGDEAFDLYLEEYEELARQGAPNKISKSSKRTPSSPKKEAVTPKGVSSSPKKSASATSAKHEKKEGHKQETSKTRESRKDSAGKKDSARKKESDDTSTYDFYISDDDDDLGPVPGLYKPMFNRDKSPKKYEIRKIPTSPEREANKKATSANVKKLAGAAADQKKESGAHKKESVVQKKEPVAQKKETATSKGKKKPAAPTKKDESSSDEFDSSSESELEEDNNTGSSKKNEDIPLWPPPKRMASLNASAMMAASTDRNVRKSIDKSPNRITEPKKDTKTKEATAEEKCKEKEKEREKKPEDFSEGPDKREKSPVKRVEANTRSDGKAEAKVSPMRSNTSQASPSKQHQSQPSHETNRRPNDQQYSAVVGPGGPHRSPGHWVQGMVSPSKPMSGVRDHSAPGSGMKSATHTYDQRPMVMTSSSPDVQMMSPPMNYQRYPPVPTASPEVQVVEVQRTGYYQGYPPPPRQGQQYSGYDRHQGIGPGYHQGLPPPAHFYPSGRGPQGPYVQGQPPSQYHQSYENQQSSPGQSGGHGGQNGLYPPPPQSQHSIFSGSAHHHQTRSQPPPAHQHRQQPPYLDPQQQSHAYGALHSMQQRYGAQPGQIAPGSTNSSATPNAAGQPHQNKQQQQQQSSHPHPPPTVYHPQQSQQMSPGQQPQLSPGQASNRNQSQPPPQPQPQQQQQPQPQPPPQGNSGGGGYQQSGSSGSTTPSSSSNGSSSGGGGGSSSNSSSRSSSSAGGASGSTGSSGAAGGAGTQNTNTTNNMTNNNSSTGPSGNVAESSSAGGGGGSTLNEFSSSSNRGSSPPVASNNATYAYPTHNAVVPVQGGGGGGAQYPYSAGSVSSASSYRVMLGRGPFNTSAFTSPPGFHHSYGMSSSDLEMGNDRRLSSPFDMNGTGDQGYYQTAGPMMQALGEACCLQPMPYHFHQQQVKVLVHNPILPSLHPFTSPMGPSIVEMARDSKPSALVSPHRMVLEDPGGQEGNENQLQQQQAQVQVQPGPLSPQQPPDPELQARTDVPIQELPDQKSDIKETAVIGNNNNEEDKKATKRCSSGNSDKNIVCKTEGDKNRLEPNVKVMKTGTDNQERSCENVVAAESTSKTPNKGENLKDKNKVKSNPKNKGEKKKKVKDGKKSKESNTGEKSKEKKKKKKNKTLNTDEGGAKGEKKKKKKKRDSSVNDTEQTDKPKKSKKKKKKNSEASQSNPSTEGVNADNPKANKPKKKKKKSKEKKEGAKASDSEGKSKKKKVISSKKKLTSPANPESAGASKGQDKNVAKGTKSEAKAKKAGTATTSTKAEQQSVSPDPTVIYGPSVPAKNQATGNPSSRTASSPSFGKAAKSTEPKQTALTPSQGNSNSPLASVSSPKAVSGNPKGTTGVLIDETSKGKSALTSPLQPPSSTKYPPGRKTPSPGKSGAAAGALKVDIELAAKGAASRKTPSPASRKTPSPSTRSTSSPGVRKTSSPHVGRKTPSPNVNRKTPSPNVGKKLASPSPVQVAAGNQKESRKTPSPKVVSSKPEPSISPKPISKPKTVSASPNQASVSPKGTGTSKGGASKPSTSKDGKTVKQKVPKKLLGVVKKDKTVVKSKKKEKGKLLSPKKTKDGSVTKKIKKKSLQLKNKLKVVLGHAKMKSAKLAKVQAGTMKSPSPPRAKPPVQAVAPILTPRAPVLASPKKLTPSPSAGKPRPRIDDIARRLSIENREKKEEKKGSGKESPGLKDSSNGKKDKGSERRNSRDKDERKQSRDGNGMKIRMVPVVCPWSWKGDPEIKQVSHTLDAPGVNRKCYPAIRHKVDGDVINVRDCVLVSSGRSKSDVPYVAKIAALWETDQGDMMMSLLWYYRPEHTESDRLPRHIGCEIFASKHWDQISVACIDDKCHVLTFNEYCRFKANQKQHMEGIRLRVQLVPAPEDQPPARKIMPSFEASPETVFLCRRVYDFKIKRILKNPT